MRDCLVIGCQRPVRTRGMCNACYEYWRKHGTTDRKPSRAEPAEARIWRLVDKDGPVPQHRPELGPCWIWTGAKTTKGYGQMTHSGDYSRVAHRAIWEIEVGPIPEGFQLDHLCLVKPCVKAILNEQGPSHLKLVTNAENMARAKALRLTCRRGHLFAGNEIIRPDSTRTCRTCTEERTKAWKSARRSRAA
jgi:hypothetical protein